jgi:hypothetical protein
MAKSLINLGSLPNDGGGDPLRTAGEKINSNFDEIYSTFGNGSTLTGISSEAYSAEYASVAGVSTVSQGLIGAPNISVGIVTASGFISAASTTPISITLLGNQLTFTAVGIGSTTFTLS